MRLSKTQKDVLFVLLGIEQRGRRGPVPNVDLFELLNKHRDRELFDNNFRISCHTLVKNGLLLKYRDPVSLKLAFLLTESGRDIAEGIFQQRVNEA
ncbi:TPA: chromosome segregation protein ParM [Aeromonas hydrophila subsp. hydrophila]|nr:chromosome segregation protein ParM [Aeromonas hydrophila subsp. hydrophila]